jgi:putative transposase
MRLVERHIIKQNHKGFREIDQMSFFSKNLFNCAVYLCRQAFFNGQPIPNITHLIIGKNENWKQNINLGIKTNQNFTNIPHGRFIQQLEYKAKLVGIKVKITTESYRSKCSFLDFEPIKKHEQYLAGLTQNRTKVGVIHELPLGNNQGFSYILRKSYLGKRVKRGLFKSQSGKHYSADLNGSLNILRKVVGDSIFDRNSALVACS